MGESDDLRILSPDSPAPPDVSLWIAESGAGLESLRDAPYPEPMYGAVLFDSAGRIGPVVAGLRGFRGYLPPDVGLPRFLACLRRVSAGQTDAPRPYLVPLVRAMEAPPLTRLDCQILRLLALGWTQQQIKQALPIGQRTLQRHVTRLLDLWEATDGHHLGAVAVALGLGWPWEEATPLIV